MEMSNRSKESCRRPRNHFCESLGGEGRSDGVVHSLSCEHQPTQRPLFSTSKKIQNFSMEKWAPSATGSFVEESFKFKSDSRLLFVCIVIGGGARERSYS